MGTGLNVGDLVATARLVDELTPAYQQTQQAASTISQNIGRSIGQISGELKVAQAAVTGLTKSFADYEGSAAIQGGIAKQLDAEIAKVAQLKQELKDLSVPPTPPTPPTPPGGGGGGGNSFDGYMGGFASDAAAYATGLIGFTAALSAVRTVESSVVGEVESATTAFAEQEAVTMRLTAALRAQGTATPEIIQSEKDLATAFQNHSTFSDKAVQSTEALLVQVGGIMPSQMRAATQATLDLAAGLGVNLDTAARMVSKSAEGNVTSLQRYGVQVDASRVASEGFSYVLGLIEDKFGGQAAAQVDTYAGRLKQLQNTWENLQEAIGGAIVQNPIVVEGMNLLGDALKSQDGKTIDATHSLSSLIDHIPLLDATIGPIVQSIEYVAQTTADWTKLLDDLSRKADAAQGSVKNLAAAFKAANVLPPWQSVMTDGDKAKEVINDVGISLNTLTEAQKQAALAAFAHGLSVNQAEQAMRAYWPDIDKSTISLDALHKQFQSGQGESKKYADAMAALDSVGGSYQQTIDGIDGSTVEAIRYYLAAGVEVGKLAVAYGLTTEQVKAVAEEQKLEQQELKNTITAMGQYETEGVKAAQAVAKGFDDGQNVLKSLAVVMGDIPVAATAITLAGFQMSNGLGKGFESVNGVISMMPDLTKQAEDHMKSFAEDATTFGESLTENLETSLTNIPHVIESAFTGGGGMQGAIQAIGSDIGGGIGKSIVEHIPGSFTSLLGDTMGSLMDDILPGIGAGIGSLLGKGLSALFNIGGPSQAELDGRKVEATFQSQFGSFDSMMKAIGEAYAAEGKSAQQAKADVMNLLNAEQQGGAAATAAMNQINGVLTQQKQDAVDLDAAIQKYGFTIDQLGPAMQKQKLDDQAQQLIKDWTLLVGSGIDLTLVNDKMASSVNDYLQMALKTGQEVPVAFKPILDKMAEQGDLTDANGVKLSVAQVDGLNYSMTMTQGFQSIVDKLQELIDKINGVPAAIDKLPKSVDVGVNFDAHWNIPDLPTSAMTMHAGGFVQKFHNGTPWVVAHAGLMPDEVPAILQTGEAVLNRRATASIGPGVISAANAGVLTGGGDVADALKPHFTAMRDSINGLRADLSTRIPAITAVAVKDAVANLPRRR